MNDCIQCIQECEAAFQEIEIVVEKTRFQVYFSLIFDSYMIGEAKRVPLILPLAT